MRFIYLVGILCAVLVGCDEASLMRKWTPPGAESAAQGYVELLRQGQFDHIEHDAEPSIVDAHSRDTLAKMAAIFPAGTPQSIKVVGGHVFHGPAYSTTDITLEYQFPSKWLLAQITTQQKGAVSSIIGFHVNPIPDSLENLNKFTLAGKSPTQYLTLICSVSSLLFALYVLSIYSVEGYEAEVAVGDYRVGWRRKIRSQLGNRPMGVPTSRNSNTVLLDDATSLWAIGSSRVSAAWSNCLLASPMEKENHRRDYPPIGSSSRSERH